jgi:LPXTG-site transpeptidase (sortase) family protein
MAHNQNFTDPSPETPDDSTIGSGSDEAANLIRQKVARLYDSEPNAAKESQEAEAVPKRSKHQQFMHALSNSGKDLATVQTEWHNYYVGLPDLEKHEVWQEFYASNEATITAPKPTVTTLEAAVEAQAVAEHKHEMITSERQKPATRPRSKRLESRSTQAIQTAIRNNVTANGKLTVKHHIQSLLFGLGMGAVVIIIFLFSFFNQIIITPFIQPSRVSASTPIILSSTSVAPTTTPEVIIPKINVQIPLNLTETSTDESAIENDLEDGVVHYPTTAFPGQQGNAAFFGHSSNNIFNPGKYKFAFVLLHTLVDGDTFYLTYNDKVYVYKVISHTIVNPSDVGVLSPIAGQTATATLITCDPPGTSINRLVVVGQQISPDPTTDGASTAQTTPTAATTTASTLPGNGPTLLGRVSRTGIGKTIGILLLVGAIIMVIRWIFKGRPVKKQFVQ